MNYIEIGGRREGIGAGMFVFVAGVCVGVLLGGLIGGALFACEREPQPAKTSAPAALTADDRCHALPGEQCECWVKPWGAK